MSEGAGLHSPIRSAQILSRAAILLMLLLAMLNLVDWSTGLRLTNMSAPLVADLRKEMELDCRFDMGNEELYAVKWYKDDQEFFRYMPRQQSDTMVFPVAGVHLVPGGTDCGQDHCKVSLRGLTRDHSGGAYRCEISSEAPAFRLASETQNITVAALPRENPRIEGLTNSYVEGDIVTAKCISAPADPAPILSWFINDHQASSKYVGEMVNSEADGMGLVSRTISLRFQAERKHSRGDTIALRCVSSLPGIPLAPQSTTVNVSLRGAQQVQVINNQKLHWYSSKSSEGALGSTSVVILCHVINIIGGVRW